ncbi:type IV secretory system conjugative DNA transfer family protein [Pygmaiobacter massiliensis]|uniref:type IV secretory system conjugative DNA transfer family protein n=1 Tax=Pygmaiobacter massiliensis TaxID=1917873 RepID=UPI002A7EC171|nr:type IV secretory system conjugative DNA transfer family protein [Pygmaiobacter massiliensis]MDY4784325.1 type IV secretory system conjugative DNA transfer family protein [Pygmaiobacter massiliensis]
MNYTKGQKWTAVVLSFFIVYLGLTFLFGIESIASAAQPGQAFLDRLPVLWPLKLVMGLLAAFVVSLLFTSKLNIKAVKVGDGQHGNAAYMDKEEQAEVYRKVQMGQEKEPGVLVGTEKGCWGVDISDNNLLLLAPPGGGKTTQNYIPTIVYNIAVQRNTGYGASMLITDVKGQLYNTTARTAQEAGYRTLVLNFRDVLSGVWFNPLYKVNEAMEQYKAATDPMQQAISYGMAERYAKVCAASLVDNMGDANSKSSASDYFDETAKGLITGLILLVSEYGVPNERHLISVFNLLLELNGQQAGKGGIKEQMNQKSRLAIVMEDIDNERIKRYVGAVMSADSRTSMNVFSSALGKLTKFIDAEVEQMICQHSPELSVNDFMEKPTIIYIICPDENTTRHFLAALFIRFFANDLIETAENKYRGVLPRKVLFMLDEFGNMPVIQDVDVLFAAIRSRGVRIMIALQSYSQLYKSYSREKAEIIKDTCQMVMFTFCSPSSQQTAESLSKMLGNETVLTGSVSYNQGRASSTSSMVGKPLVSPAEMVLIPWGTWVLMKAGHKPMRSHMLPYGQFLSLPTSLEQLTPKPYTTVCVSTTDTIIGRAKDKEVYLQKGMFD